MSAAASSLRRGSVAVVGAAESDLGQVAPNTSPVDLMAQATMRALDDCGLKLSDIDGVFSAATQVRTAPMTLSEYLRIKPKYFDGTAIGGSRSGTARESSNTTRTASSCARRRSSPAAPRGKRSIVSVSSA